MRALEKLGGKSTQAKKTTLSQVQAQDTYENKGQ